MLCTSWEIRLKTCPALFPADLEGQLWLRSPNCEFGKASWLGGRKELSSETTQKSCSAPSRLAWAAMLRALQARLSCLVR